MCAQHRPPEITPPTGLTVVVPHDSPVLDIVFVHGFTGHPERTWSHRRDGSKQPEDDDDVSEPQHKSRRLNPFSTAHRDRDSAHSAVFWPRDLLPATVPNARVLAYGYDTHIRHWAAQPICRSTVRDVAWDFLVALEAGRRAEPARPLLFIVHSLGGIVVKELLRRANGCRQGQNHLRSIFESTRGIMFFGTPHNGADPRGSLQHIAELVIKAIGFKVNEQIVNALLPSSERLAELRDEFGSSACEQRWMIHSFQEQLGVKALSGRKVVEDNSSYLNLPAVETTEHISRNHMDMCRFSGLEDVEYKKVAAALQRMIAGLAQDEIPNPGTSLTPGQRQQLRDSLRFDQIDARQMNIKSAHAKTCKWLRKKGEYIDWLDPGKFSDHHGFLWVKGKPGAGKSTLMKFALAQARRSMRDCVILSFFFNARGEALEKTTAGMYRSLLLQLLEHIPGLDNVFDSLCLALSRGDQMLWSIESLKDLFEQAVQSLGRSQVVCFIDALDECDEDQVRDMLSAFQRIGELAVASNIWFRVCFSSRHYPHITIARGLELVLEGQEGHDQDIADYVGSELQIGHSKVAEEIRAEVQAKASSVFMWVVLVVDILNREYDRGRIHALRKRLREIPADLHALFRDILTRDTRDKEELILCIQWVLYAQRPLRPEELYFAVLAGTDPEYLEPWNCDIVTPAIIERFILDSSKGLAEKTKSKVPVVQFIHESVREFLLKDNGLQSIWPDLGARFYGPSHERLKECCLKYISTLSATLSLPNPLPMASSEDAGSLRDQTQHSYPLLEYAVRNVLHHADQAESHRISQSGFLQNFPLQSWIKMDNLCEKFEARRRSSEASFLYVLAEKNLPHLIRAHFATSSPLESCRGRYETPFFAALATGSTDAVLAFADLELRNANPPTSFQRLCQRYLEDPNEIPKLGLAFRPSKHFNWFELVRRDDSGLAQFLMDIGKIDRVDVSVRSNGRTPLSIAAEEGHKTMVELLLSMDDVDPHAEDNNGRTPLYWAALQGHEAVCKSLLNMNIVNPDAKDHFGLTPLYRAVERGHKAVCKLLLNTNKVDPDAKDNSGDTPLCCAVKQGHAAICKLLLDMGRINPDAKNDFGRTPLSYAAENSHQGEAIVKLLLGISKVNPDTKDKLGRTPLFWAVQNLKQGKTIVKLLLSTGKVTLDTKDNSGQTPLSYAAQNLIHGEAIIKLLLSIGEVKLDIQDNLGRTPLSHAAENSRQGEAIVKLLLGTGKVNLDTKDTLGKTPLSYAAENPQQGEAIVKLLLGTGKVNPATKDNSGQTPLSYAAKNSQQGEAIVKLLLSMGKANPDAEDSFRKTPLFYAAENPQQGEAILRLLSEHATVPELAAWDGPRSMQRS